MSTPDLVALFGIRILGAIYAAGLLVFVVAEYRDRKRRGDGA